VEKAVGAVKSQIDPAKMKQVVDNLLSNGVKYSTPTRPA
jgi:signal transduction histidine kinase